MHLQYSPKPALPLKDFDWITEAKMWVFQFDFQSQMSLQVHKRLVF